MKFIYFFIFFILNYHMIHSNQHTPIIYKVKTSKASALVLIFPSDKYFPDSPNQYMNYFCFSAFTIPKIFENIKNKHKQILLFVPDYFENVSPIEKTAPIKEGVRIALAWASAYFRFKELGNIDIRICILPPEKITPEMFNNAVKSLMHINIVDDFQKSPEDQLKNRIFHFKNLPFIHSNNKTVTTQIQSAEQSLFDTSSNKELIMVHLPKQLNNQKRFLITGATGFLGSYLTKKLLKLGHQVIGLDIAYNKKNCSKFMHNKNFQFHQFDITKPFNITEALDGVIHFASVPSPQSYYKKPIETLKSGIEGTKITLDLAREKNALYLFSSTSEVYGDPEINPQPEHYPGKVNPIGMRSQYDESKRAAETLIKLYAEKYQIDARIVRIFNTYGPGMSLNDGRVVTNFIDAALHNKPLVILGNGLQTRSFAYVSDTIDGIIKVLLSDKIKIYPIEKRIFNVGSQQEFTVLELAKEVNHLAEKYLNRTISITFQNQKDKDDPKKRQPDLSHISSLLGYFPKISLKKGLKKTFLFFKQNYYDN